MRKIKLDKNDTVMNHNDNKRELFSINRKLQIWGNIEMSEPCTKLFNKLAVC